MYKSRETISTFNPLRSFFSCDIVSSILITGLTLQNLCLFGYKKTFNIQTSNNPPKSIGLSQSEISY